MSIKKTFLFTFKLSSALKYWKQRGNTHIRHIIANVCFVLFTLAFVYLGSLKSSVQKSNSSELKVPKIIATLFGLVLPIHCMPAKGGNVKNNPA